MHNNLIIILVLFFFKAYSQENSKIDSLENEVLVLERQIKEITDEIKSEIIQNEYFIAAIRNKGSSSIALQDEESRKVIGIIPKGVRIRVIGKTSNFYRVKYKNLVGLVDEYNLKIDSTSSLYFLYPRISKIETSGLKPFRSNNKKSLDYSKPIKVRGHYRRTKSGKRVWVRPHTRKH